jgi:hypothetical protein
MRTSWHIENKTQWATKDLKKVFVEAKRRVDRDENRANHAVYLKIINSNRFQESSWGHAAIRGYSITIITSVKNFDTHQKRRLAQLFTHEYYHNLGCQSIDHRNYRADFTESLDYSWADKYEISKKESKPKIKIDHLAKRKEAAIRNLKMAETRLKRAKTIREKWYRKVQYYSK